MLRGGDGEGTQFCEHHLHSPSPHPVYVFNPIDNRSICVFLAYPARRDDSPPKAQIIRNVFAILVLRYQLQCPLSSSTRLLRSSPMPSGKPGPQALHISIQSPRSSNTKRVDGNDLGASSSHVVSFILFRFHSRVPYMRPGFQLGFYV